MVWSSFASTTQRSYATVIESLLNVASLVWNSRIVFGGPKGLGALKIDLSQLSILVPSQFDPSERAVFLRCRTASNALFGDPGVARAGCYPLSSTTSQTTRRESGSTSDVGGSIFAIRPSLFARMFCSKRSLSFNDSPGKYIWVITRLIFPVTSK